jgi:hypothetical protein
MEPAHFLAAESVSLQINLEVTTHIVRNLGTQRPANIPQKAPKEIFLSLGNFWRFSKPW